MARKRDRIVRASDEIFEFLQAQGDGEATQGLRNLYDAAKEDREASVELRQKIKGMGDKYAELRKESSEIKKANHSLKEEKTAIERILANTEKELDGYVSANSDLKAEKESLFEANQALAKQVNQITVEMDAEVEAHNAAKHKIQELDENNRAFRRANDSHADVTRELESENGDLKTENAELRADLHIAEEGIKTLNQQVMEGQSRSDDPRFWMWLFIGQIIAWPTALYILNLIY